MQYGYFDDQAREYVITNPKTPVKWINYIGTLAFGGFVDHTGGALICKEDPSLNRITKYIPQLPSSEFKGETLYVRIKQGNSYQVFSPYFVPTLDPYNRYECHVGLGYTRIVSEFFGVKTDVTIFVPLEETRVIRVIRFSNMSSQPLEIDVIPVVEYTHPDALKQFTNADWVPQTMQSKAVIQEGALVTLLQYPFMFRDLRINYFTSNQPVSSFETDRAKFLGDNEYGTWANPLSLRQPELGCSQALRGDNIAALLHHQGVVQPGETRRVITQLGQEANLEDAQPGIERFRQVEQVEYAFDQMRAFWNDYLAHMQVKTPDEGVDSMLNVHNPHQCFITFNWSRYLSLYQLGLGTRGMGMRDSSQDVMAVVSPQPVEAKALIRKLLSMQRKDGSALHQFNPLTMVGSEGDSLERADCPHYYSDDSLWVVLAVAEYLKETGDFTFLDELIPFYGKDQNASPLERATVTEHMKRALEFTKGDIGTHGLPRLGFADWNDTVNLAAGAESVFTAELYGKALLEMIDLAQHLGIQSLVDRYASDHQAMKACLNAQAWDGAWYISYFDYDGTPLGSKSNPYGQIYVNTQSWAVISGFATPERARAAMEAVYARLNTPNGIKLSTPGFNGFDPQRGGVTTYPPGAKENGGIFLHTNPWQIIAETLLGNGRRAYQYYRQINPAAKNNQIDEFQCEPYVYPQNILGDEHPQFGLARNSWLSGTAAWMYRAGTQFLLGIQPTYDGLRIDPCISPEWDRFEATRRFRGAVYLITVKNPHRASKGVNSMVVDGTQVTGNLVSCFDSGEHRIEIILED
jgi:cellobiose phosphorylase